VRPKRLFPVQRVCFFKMQRDELRALLGNDAINRLTEAMQSLGLQGVRLGDLLQEPEAEAEAAEAEAAEAEAAEAEAVEAEAVEAEAVEAEAVEAEAAEAEDAEAEAEASPAPQPEPSTPRADHLPNLTLAEMGSNEKLGKRTTISKGGFSLTCKSISSAIRTIQEREPEFADEPIKNMQMKVSNAKQKRDNGFILFGYTWHFHRAVHSRSTNVSESTGHLLRVVWENGPPEVFTDYPSVREAATDGLFPYFQRHPELIRHEDNRFLLQYFCGRHTGRYGRAELEAMRNELNFVENETIVNRLTRALQDKLRDNGYNVVFFGIRVFQFQNG
jgi:hypothetical protein